MSKPLLLPSFDGADEPMPDPGAQTDIRLAAYEEGYKAGWDDALSANERERSQIGSELAQSLQDLSFPFHEARNHVLSALRPVLVAMAERVLPTAARAHFAAIVLEAAMKLAEEKADAPVEIAVALENAGVLQELIGSAAVALPLRVASSATLGPSEALIRSAGTEREIDLEKGLAAIARALDEFLATPTESRAHG